MRNNLIYICVINELLFINWDGRQFAYPIPIIYLCFIGKIILNAESLIKIQIGSSGYGGGQICLPMFFFFKF